MKKIFDKKGVFINEKIELYKLNEEEVINRAIKETKLMYDLRNAITGKDVRVIVFEEDGNNDKIKTRREDFVVRDYGDLVGFFYDGSFSARERVVVCIGDFEVHIFNKDGFRVVFRKSKRKQISKKVIHDDGDVARIRLG